jgi:hypothetical protein
MVLVTWKTDRNLGTRIQKYSPALSQAEKVQGDQKVSVHLMITIQKVTSNVQTVPRQSSDIY